MGRHSYKMKVTGEKKSRVVKTDICKAKNPRDRTEPQVFVN